MNKYALLLSAFALSGGMAMAQDAGKMVKSGSKALSKYTSDATNMEALDEARSTADQAIGISDADEDDIADAYLLRANAYAAEINATSKDVQLAQVTAQTSGEPAPSYADMEYPGEQATIALESYKEAYTRAEKSRDKDAAIKGMQEFSGSISTLSNVLLGAARYEDAYKPLKMLGEINSFYVANDEDPLFADADAENQQKYITAIVASQAKDNETAKRLYRELYDAEYPEANVYAGYSQVLMADGDEEGGLAALNKGRELFPDDSDILFAEINYYIQQKDFVTLEQKLQAAIAKEPDNVGLYNALGNVYMNLSQDTLNVDKSDEYMEKSISYFDEAINRDDSNLDATYSIGSLYYNRAVAKTTEMNNLGTSKAEQAKYDQLNNEISELFTSALPYFEKAEQMDGNDRNTLIALKEIYARQNDFEKSKEYKERLDAMGGR